MSPRPLLRRMGRFLKARKVQFTLFMLLLALLILFVSPFIAIGEFRPFEAGIVRLTCLLFLVLAWGVGGYILNTRRNREEAALLAALRKQKEEANATADKTEAELNAELSIFRQAARNVILFLRQKRSSLFVNPRYSLPWYLVLGATGCGKTSLIRNSGLVFAPEEDILDSVSAAHFHISDQAIFIETTGKLLTQKERESTILWQHMLDHLRRLKPRQPINGILIVIGTDQLLTMTLEDSVQYAWGIRRRVDEVSSRLRSDLPIYLAVTKQDLIIGFEEFFESLSVEERSNIFGLSVAQNHPKNSIKEIGLFQKRFVNLIKGLAQQQFIRLEEESDELHRRRILEFPSQFALLQSKLEPLVQQLLAPQRFGPLLNVRGVFFSSALQFGQSSDMLVGSMSVQFAQKAETMVLRNDTVILRTHAFFLKGLFNNVILSEANLSGLTKSARLFIQSKDIAANSVLFITAFAVLAFWWFSFKEGRAYMARISETATIARSEIATISSKNNDSQNFEPILNVLDRLRKLAEEKPNGPKLWLYGTGSVEETSWKVYDRALQNLFFPFVWRYLKEQLAAPQTPAEQRFQQLKLYLMLTGKQPVNRKTAAFLGPDFATNWLLKNQIPDIDRRVTSHFAELASVEIIAPSADLELIDKARSYITDYTLAQLAYDMAQTLLDTHQLQIWRPVDHMGLAGPAVLTRVSGISLWDGIKGMYTKAGLKDVIQNVSLSVADTVASDLWVMGIQNDSAERSRETQRIREGLLDLYRVEYIRQWDTLLADLTISSRLTPDEMAHAVAILIGPPSPIQEILTAIAEETNLETVSTTVINNIATEQLQKINATTPRRVINFEKSITDHFRTFREAVITVKEQKIPLDTVLEALKPLYEKINYVATGGDVLDLGAQPPVLLNALSDKIHDLPIVLQPLFTRILNQVAAVLSGSSRERLSQIWSTTVLPACLASTQGRYPFDPQNDNDASLEDFARVFAPKGAIATFRNAYLKPFIDSFSKPWHWRKDQQSGFEFDDTVLKAFELANDITTLYFGDQDAATVQFSIKPVKLDVQANAVQLDLDGSTLVYSHGPLIETHYQWPSEKITMPAALSLTPEIEGKENSVSRQGAWALFRLFDLGHVLESNPTDIASYQFNIGGRLVVLQITAPVIRNPFIHNIPSEFKCPRL